MKQKEYTVTTKSIEPPKNKMEFCYGVSKTLPKSVTFNGKEYPITGWTRHLIISKKFPFIYLIYDWFCLIK